jgi:hypothetical protein
MIMNDNEKENPNEKRQETRTRGLLYTFLGYKEAKPKCFGGV